ncbi:MAG TPA: diacylglycerol kinase family protein [Steroidobacteraceae bacterium]|nr:diacylglycerol kinase family protein [Steroidobacteraceae bacterium]
MSDSHCWFIVINPASGGGGTRRFWRRLRTALDSARLQYRPADSTAAGSIPQLVGTALHDGHRRFLALGGDGTFNELVNALASQITVPLAQCLAGVAALGTGNDWARAMQVPDDPERLALLMARGAGRDVDLGVAVDASGTRRYFHNVAGAGLDAEVVRCAPRRGPRPLAYLAGLARTLAGFRAPQFSVTADGRAQSGKFWLVLAANGPCCGGGMQLAPAARLDDGWLDLVTVAPLGAGAALAKLPKLFDGRLSGDPAITVTRCRSATIASEPSCGVELDGEPAGNTPVTIQLMPSALRALDCRDSAE